MKEITQSKTRLRYLFSFLLILLIVGTASAQSVYYPAKGNGDGTLTTPSLAWCTSQGLGACKLYNEGSLAVGMDANSVKYAVQNNLGEWRYIKYDIPNPNNIIPTIDAPSKSLIWTNIYANNTSLAYHMQSHGIKLDIYGAGTPPSNIFNFTYFLSSGINPQKRCSETESCEIDFFDSNTGELLWTVNYPSMQVNNTDVPLTFQRIGDKISIHAPDLFTNPEYNFSAGWELDPSTQSGNTIYISDRHNLTEVNADINNVSALQNLGSGEWLLNANLVNNNTANSFYLNSSDVTWLKINSTYDSSVGVKTFWYYLTNGKTEINNTKITSWNTTSSAVDTNFTVSRSSVYASGASSKMNISNSNLSYLGYNAANMYGVYYTLSDSAIITNSKFLDNYYGLYITGSNNNIVTNSTCVASSQHGLYITNSNNNIVTNSTGTTTSGYAIGLVSSNNNTIINSTGTTGNNVGIYLSSSNNNTITNSSGVATSGSGIKIISSNNNTIYGGVYSTSSYYAYYIRDSYLNNLFNKTDFTTSRKIYFFDAVSIFEQDNGNGVIVRTHPSWATGMFRYLYNWTQSNITFSETYIYDTTVIYNVSGLSKNTNYQIWNGTTNDFNLTTDENGVLPSFIINFSTPVKTVKILQTGAYTPTITSWQNNKTLDDALTLNINISENVTFNASADQTIATWNWYKDNIDQSNNYDNISLSWNSIGNKTVIVNATNENGTTNSIQWNITILDGSFPTYSGVGHNQTYKGKPTLFYANFSDGIALETNGQYIFQFDNGTGTLESDSPINFTSTPQWGNVTKVINSTAGTTIRYRWNFTDNIGNSNNTEIYSFNTTQTINISSCNSSDVQNAIDNSIAGDIVSIPSGVCTWTSGITIPDAKKITLQGAGIGNTIINFGNIILFGLGTSGSRITGFELNGSSTSGYGVYVGGTGWRVDHNKVDFTSSGGKGLAVFADNANRYYPTWSLSGLVDNNIFINAQSAVSGSAVPGGGTSAFAIMSSPSDFGGTSNYVYYEDNTYYINVFGNLMDTNYGGGYVFRFNTINKTYYSGGAAVEAHSLQSLSRATKKWEIYGNTIHGEDNLDGLYLRGGTGFVFDNNFSGLWISEILLDNIRSYSDAGPGPCNGTTNWDGNIGTGNESGYPCRDQIGRGNDESPWTVSAPYPNQSLSPTYIFNNSPSFEVGVSGGSYYHIQQNRDYYQHNSSFDGKYGIGVGILANMPSTCTVGVGYWATDQGSWNKKPGGEQGILYKCTVTDTWEEYYIPYTYPHPLATEEGYVAPVITNVVNGTVTDTTAIINFTIDQADATSQIKYGKNESLSSSTTNTSSGGYDRQETLTSLDPSTKYYYSVFAYNSANASLYTNSTIQNFTTTAYTPPAEVAEAEQVQFIFI